MVGNGADGDEVTGAAPHEMWDQGARHEKRSQEIHGDRAGELVGRRLPDRLDEEDTRVVHHHVWHSPLGEDAADGALHRCGVGHVTTQVRPTVGRAVHHGAGEPHDVSPRAVQQLGDGEPDPARRAGDERELPGEGGGGRVAHPGPRLYTSRRNSSRVFASCSSAPRRALVTVLEFCFSTPRIIMQRWYASITTPTPRWSSISRTRLSNDVRAPAAGTGGNGSVCSSWKLRRLADFILSRPMLVEPPGQDYLRRT